MVVAGDLVLDILAGDSGEGGAQQAHDVYITSAQRRCCIDVELTLYKLMCPLGGVVGG